MSGRSDFKQPSPRYLAHSNYQALQDLIFEQAHVNCSVMVMEDRISIRAVNYADFLLAKAAIKGRTTLPIVFDNVPGFNQFG